MRYRFLYDGAARERSSQASANTARPRIRAGVSRDMPVYFPSFAGYSFQPDYRGRAQAE